MKNQVSALKRRLNRGGQLKLKGAVQPSLSILALAMLSLGVAQAQSVVASISQSESARVKVAQTEMPRTEVSQIKASQTDTPQTDAPQTVLQTFDAITVMGEKLNQATPWATQTERQTLDALQILNWSEFGSRAEPGVNYNASNRSINIRGLDQNRVLTRIDGIRQSYLKDIRGDMGGVKGGLNTIDFNTLSSIDIVRGSDSSTVGSGALGGVVDVQTLNPSDLLVGGKTFGALGKTSYQSVDNSWLVNAAVAGQGSDRFQWLFQAGTQQGNQTINQGTVGGYGIGRTEPNPDDYTQQNYMLKLQQQFDGGHKLGLTGVYFERQDNVNDLTASPTTYAPGKSDLTEQSTRESIALDYAWAAQGQKALLDSFAAQVYWQKVELSSNLNATRIASPRGAYQRKNTIQESTYGLELEAAKSINGQVNQLWQSGFEWFGTQTQQYVSGQDTCTSYRFPPCSFLHANQADVPTTNGDQYGAWLQNTLDFAQGQFSLQPAIRYDSYSQRPDNSSFGKNPAHAPLQSSSGEAWSPKLLATWRPLETLSLFVQYAQGFNAPTATQLYSRYGAPGTYLVQGNPNLKAETSEGWEIGTKFGTSQANGALTYFDNRYKNFIENVTASGTRQYPYFIQSYENLDNVRIYGLEAKGEWYVTKGWRTYGSMAWAVGQNQNTKQNLNSVAPLTGIFGVEYSQSSWSVRSQLTAAAARTQVAYPNATVKAPNPDFQAPGYGIVDLMATWRPEQFKGLTLQAGIFNLFDKTYWNALDIPTAGVTPISRPLDAYSQPGRNFSISLSYLY